MHSAMPLKASFKCTALFTGIVICIWPLAIYNKVQLSPKFAVLLLISFVKTR